MSDPMNDGHDSHPPLANRARPGLKGMGTKTALFLLVLALLPLAGLPLFFSKASEQLSAPIASLEKELRGTHQSAGEQRKEIEKLRDEVAQAGYHKAQQEHAQKYNEGLKKLRKQLEPLLADKTAEELAGEESIAEIIKKGPAQFQEIALIELKSQKLLAARSAAKGKTISEALPGLKAAYQPDQTTPGPDKKWNWLVLGETGLLLAVSAEPPPSPAKPSPAADEPFLPSEALADISQATGELHSRVWALMIALPLFALVLALITLWWINSQLLVPVRSLTGAARLALDDPEGDPNQLLSRAGQLQDLGDSIARLRERHRRLRSLDQAAEMRTAQMVKVKAAVDRAASGKLGLRAPVEPGEGEELALAINRLLESVTGWIDTIRGIGQQLESSSERLAPVAERLANRMEPEDSPGFEPGGLADYLEVQIDSLCTSAGKLTEEFERAAPPIMTSADIDSHRSAMSGPGTGIKLLLERIAEVTLTTQPLAGLRQDAEVLATNLAICAEANSPGQIEKLVSDARALSRTVVDLSDRQSKTLNQLSSSGEQLKSGFNRVNEQYVQVVRKLAEWEALRRAIDQLRSDMERQLSAVRPGARSLSGDLRQLATSSGDLRKQQRDLRDTLDAAGRGISALTAASKELLDLLDKIDTGAPLPMAVTQNLAQQQHELETAIRDLTDLAGAEGIDALSSDTQLILENIRDLADQARTRISSDEGQEQAQTDDPASQPPPADAQESDA